MRFQQSEHLPGSEIRVDLNPLRQRRECQRDLHIASTRFQRDGLLQHPEAIFKLEWVEADSHPAECACPAPYCVTMRQPGLVVS